MKILSVCPFPPIPATSGGSLRTLNLIKQLAARDEVDLICVDSGTAPEHREQLQRCVRQLILPRQDKPARIFQIFQTGFRLLCGVPFYAKYVNSRELKRELYRLSRDGGYDVILFNHSHMAVHRSSLHPAHGAATVLDLHNIAFLQFQRMYEFEKDPWKKLKLLLTWLPMRRWEPRMTARFDQVITVSETDRKLLLGRAPGLRVSLIPNGVDTAELLPFPREGREKNILLVGSMDYEPNVDAALYLLEKIFPLIRRQEPQCRLTIIGQRPPDSLRRLDGKAGVTVRGDVEDVRPYYRNALVSVVAMRSGGGTRLKILEAMALGTPVVSTSVGCEGLDVKDQENILVADHPEDFARHVLSLMNDADRWTRIAHSARAMVEQRYDWSIIGGQLQELLIQVVSPASM